MNAIGLLRAAHARLPWLLDEHPLLPRAAHDARVATMDRFRADLMIHRPVATYSAAVAQVIDAAHQSI